MEYIDFHTHRPVEEGVVTPRSHGVHPWHADEEPSTSFTSFRIRHLDAFAAAEVVGECGLDKACQSTWERQVELFDWQLRIAEELQKPVVVHCVRAYNELMELRCQHRMTAWAVHGFSGGIELARQLWNSRIAVSFGAALLDTRRTKLRNCLRELESPFLLETDTDPCGIATVYAAAAAIRGVETETMAHAIKTNYLALLDTKQT